MEQADRDAIVAELNTLLEAERAGARVGASLVSEARSEAFKALSKTIQADEVKWARALYDAVIALGGTPSEAVGDFYGKAMAIDGFEARLAFVNRGQGWVVRRLREVLPGVDEPSLREVLQAMLDAHVVNIEAANAALEAARPASA